MACYSQVVPLPALLTQPIPRSNKSPQAEPFDRQVNEAHHLALVFQSLGNIPFPRQQVGQIREHDLVVGRALLRSPHVLLGQVKLQRLAVKAGQLHVRHGIIWCQGDGFCTVLLQVLKGGHALLGGDVIPPGRHTRNLHEQQPVEGVEGLQGSGTSVHSCAVAFLGLDELAQVFVNVAEIHVSIPELRRILQNFLVHGSSATVLAFAERLHCLGLQNIDERHGRQVVVGKQLNGIAVELFRLVQTPHFLQHNPCVCVAFHKRRKLFPKQGKPNVGLGILFLLGTGRSVGKQLLRAFGLHGLQRRLQRPTGLDLAPLAHRLQKRVLVQLLGAAPASTPSSSALVRGTTTTRRRRSKRHHTSHSPISSARIARETSPDLGSGHAPC
eukprot:m.33869 g.33869  ORF g.33869 m.33869 type:complete len:384 (+) comp12960_c0_seq3:1323-2474(+)